MAREPNDYALRSIHADRIVKRQIDELVGLAKGALLDGKVEQHEADGILAWLHGNVECLDTWPASVLYDRLRAMLADGVLDPDEAGELLGLLMQIAAPAGLGAAPAPSTLPLTAPAPEILYPGRSFCFTGVFEFGSRADCHAWRRTSWCTPKGRSRASFPVFDVRRRNRGCSSRPSTRRPCRDSRCSTRSASR